MTLGDVIDRRTIRYSKQDLAEARERFRIAKEKIGMLFDCLICGESAVYVPYKNAQGNTRYRLRSD